MSSPLRFLLAGAILWAPMGAAHAQQASMPEPCRATSSSAFVTVVVCEPGLDPSVLRDAGRQACGMRSQCNAWIWDDAAKAPARAPLTDADLPKHQAGTAVAVWVNDSQSLITLERAK